MIINIKVYSFLSIYQTKRLFLFYNFILYRFVSTIASDLLVYLLLYTCEIEKLFQL